MPGFLILGASSDIAADLVRRLHAAGHQSLLAARDVDRLADLAAETNSETVAFDAADGASVQAAFDAAKERFGPFQNGEGFAGAANMVGSFLMKAAHLTSDEEWSDTLRTNLDSAFYCVRSAGKALRDGGSVVLMGSVAGRIGVHSHEAIAAAKAGVAGLTRSAAATYAHRGLRFNCVSPGLTQTKLTERIWKSEPAAEASRDMHALHRLGEPGDVAAAVAFLLDPAHDWITGQEIGVDGGMSAVVVKNQKRS
ncbi:SDR family NAD(P)-dependent oxidoreductase [Alienimonas californiensis]|uniref:3-oxoacyl-[acyl-carrier-protein] reductase FabG n=1 Tax=Alienimonas californiensis TaxID=2527989 RepID=A0A517PBR6_9PLAN|nr:SDR family oxidoreductase [Alienimonas californiensis]QDT16825.1 3-oxoacyl-[acyl-carrier-protein] reductase FabG [Alienimonas californiensis]